MFKSKNITLAVGMTVVALTSQAWANPVTYLGTGLTTDVTITHNGSNMYVRAGEIFIDYSAIKLTAYCVDLDHWVKNAWDATPASVSTINGGLEAAWLYDHFAKSVTTGAEGAALQIAIWEVVDDFGGTPNLSTGNFSFSGAKSVLTSAQSYLNAMPSDLSGYTTPSFIVKSGDVVRSQNLIVPEPAALALLASGLPILLAGRRR
ncbi:MAG TPA: PEP-CTERM sorting domain-containing protein [Phycisphaerae bacterium]|nr:PEP-CTERM sorting domain-containing protein [Phycisphaerae bacterium]